MGTPVGDDVDFSVLSSVAREIRRLGGDSRTQGVKGEKRRAVLVERLIKLRSDLSSAEQKDDRDEEPKVAKRRSSQSREKREKRDRMMLTALLDTNQPPPPEQEKEKKRANVADEMRSRYAFLHKAAAKEARGSSSTEVVAVEPKQKAADTKQHDNKPSASGKPFVCETCGKRFKMVAHLVVHRRTHLGQKAKAAVIAVTAAKVIEGMPKMIPREAAEKSDDMYALDDCKDEPDNESMPESADEGEGDADYRAAHEAVDAIGVALSSFTFGNKGPHRQGSNLFSREGGDRPINPVSAMSMQTSPSPSPPSSSLAVANGEFAAYALRPGTRGSTMRPDTRGSTSGAMRPTTADSSASEHRRYVIESRGYSADEEDGRMMSPYAQSFADSSRASSRPLMSPYAQGSLESSKASSRPVMSPYPQGSLDGSRASSRPLMSPPSRIPTPATEVVLPKYKIRTRTPAIITALSPPKKAKDMPPTPDIKSAKARNMLAEEGALGGALRRIDMLRPDTAAIQPPPPNHPPPNAQADFSESGLPEMRRELQVLTNEALALNEDIVKMDQQRQRAIEERIRTRKDIELQELEWELERVLDECKRAETHRGMFISSRFASESGHNVRLPTKDLVKVLRGRTAKVRHQIADVKARIAMVEEEDDEHGLAAQDRRLDNYRAYQDDIATLRRRIEAVETAANQTDADRLGHAALLMHMVQKKPIEAHRLYRKAIKANKAHATNLGNFALFYTTRKKIRRKLPSTTASLSSIIQSMPIISQTTPAFSTRSGATLIARSTTTRGLSLLIQSTLEILAILQPFSFESKEITRIPEKCLSELLTLILITQII